ncbi:Rieske (2Fe-2S) protein [Sporolactobacillus sp. KGMB 08714]|uniref:Rieske (2Fe-2S) protein n=1 Tax=Sporolactobacillus sp. KGMB 08714 TaxID=3064704 RepID=UPI002FBD4B7F
MNRRSFFKEVARSLTETGKEVIYPLFENDIEKIERAADVLQGISWYPVDHLSLGYGEQMISGRLVCFFFDGQKAAACGKECRECHEMAQWIAYDQQLVCPGCEKSFSLREKGGSLNLAIYPVKNEQQKWWVGLPDKGVFSDA